MNSDLTRALGIATVVLVALGDPTRASAQAVWQADMRVQSLAVAARGGQLSARAVIYSDNDDDAKAARAEILLPVGVGVLRLPAGCKATATTGVAGLHGRVTCDLGDIEVRGLRELLIVTTGITGGANVRFAVFVTSDTPDPSPANNYAERAVP